ncbi:hypothetical protein [Desmospora profundinema]|uniref:Pyruvate/2-oxoglutarate dehydrogenase complex dihydrolipoamide dehydrogenase (E3) component n=1 Tax=Desmospora profundinema TaxID=1571184 RepID=A0ABU1IPW8_9BACL|nr:hypothetical protein [Desmospora profundinema]MDR6226846.1 pyruvate/2-oxoglutarate dehydrogenase complex dihydrolipoamide dehydrogenase (E3) component [Desmospora profundinema]
MKRCDRIVAGGSVVGAAGLGAKTALYDRKLLGGYRLLAGCGSR